MRYINGQLSLQERDKRRRGKKRQQDEDDDEFSYYKDKYEFGEVVYEPPSLDTEKLTRKVDGNNVKVWIGFLLCQFVLLHSFIL